MTKQHYTIRRALQLARTAVAQWSQTPGGRHRLTVDLHDGGELVVSNAVHQGGELLGVYDATRIGPTGVTTRYRL